jgi:hypothetical protein
VQPYLHSRICLCNVNNIKTFPPDATVTHPSPPFRGHNKLKVLKTPLTSLPTTKFPESPLPTPPRHYYIHFLCSTLQLPETNLPSNPTSSLPRPSLSQILSLSSSLICLTVDISPSLHETTLRCALLRIWKSKTALVRIPRRASVLG